MRLAYKSLLGYLIVAILASVPSKAQQSPAQVPIKVDRYGDPLPAKAVLRLGTVRLRQADGVSAVAFSPDGKQVATGGHDGPPQIWDVATGGRVRLLPIIAPNDSNNSIRSLAYSPDGAKIAAGKDGGEILICDVLTGKLLAKCVAVASRLYDASISAVAFSPDGGVVASAGGRTSVQIWDVASGEMLWTLTAAGKLLDASSVAFSPDGQSLAAGTRNGVYVWDLAKGGEPRDFSGERVISLSFTPGGNTLICGGGRFERGPTPRSGRTVSELIAWDLTSGAQLPGFQSGEVLPSQAAFDISADGRTLVSAHTGKIIVWDVPTRSVVRVIPGKSNYQYGGYGGAALAVSPDGKLVAAAGGVTPTNKVFFWDTATGEPLHPQTDTHTDEIISEAFSPDGKWIATGSSDATVRLWNATTGEHVRKLDEGDGWLKYVEFLPDGKSLLLARETHSTLEPGYKGEIKIVSLIDGAVRQHMTTPDRVICGAMSNDGSRVAVGIGLGEGMPGLDGGGNPKILVFDTASGEKVCELAGDLGQVQHLMFCADGKEIWSAGADPTLRKWNAASGQEISRVPLPADQRGAFYRKVFMPGAARIVFSGMETVDRRRTMGRLSLNDVEGLTARWEKRFEDAWPAQIAASPDGRLVATFLWASAGSKLTHRIVLWNAEDGRELDSFELTEGPVRSLAFSRDSKLLTSGMELGDTLVWDVNNAPR